MYMCMCVCLSNINSKKHNPKLDKVHVHLTETVNCYFFFAYFFTIVKKILLIFTFLHTAKPQNEAICLVKDA